MRRHCCRPILVHPGRGREFLYDVKCTKILILEEKQEVMGYGKSEEKAETGTEEIKVQACDDLVIIALCLILFWEPFICSGN